MFTTEFFATKLRQPTCTPKYPRLNTLKTQHHTKNPIERLFKQNKHESPFFILPSRQSPSKFHAQLLLKRLLPPIQPTVIHSRTHQNLVQRPEIIRFNPNIPFTHLFFHRTYSICLRSRLPDRGLTNSSKRSFNRCNNRSFRSAQSG